MSRIAALFPLLLVATACSGHRSETLGGYGVSVRLPKGWYGLAGPGQLQVADYPLARNVLASPERARTGRGHVHLVIWDGGPEVPYLALNHPRMRPPFGLRRQDVSSTPFEGFPFGHTYARRAARLQGDLVDVLADFGPGALGSRRLAAANRVLASLHVASSREIRPHDGVLRSDGIELRLPAGWSGRIEIPPAKYAARLVVRARRGEVRIVLLELPRSIRLRRIRLPVIVDARGLVRFTSAPTARRVFSVNGRSFDLSVVFRSSSDLAQANRVLRTLKVRR